MFHGLGRSFSPNPRSVLNLFWRVFLRTAALGVPSCPQTPGLVSRAVCVHKGLSVTSGGNAISTELYPLETMECIESD